VEIYGFRKGRLHPEGHSEQDRRRQLPSNVLDAVTKEKDRWSVKASDISLQVAFVVQCEAGCFQRQLISILESNYLHLNASNGMLSQ
jgi:hypothetical protein